MILDRPPAPTAVTVASAPAWVHRLLRRPLEPATVVHAGPDAVYLEVGSACLGVLGVRAARLPCGVRTTLRTLPLLAVGSTVDLGEGAVHLPAYRVEPTAVVDVRLPDLAPAVVAAGRSRLEPLLSTVAGERSRELPSESLQALAGGDPVAVARLLGRGPGLTPLGDDALVGWLAAAVAVGHPALPAVRRSVLAQAPHRTTLLSATLLAGAARGEVVPELVGLLRTLSGGDLTATARALAALLALGGTSGAGMALGCLAGLRSSSSGGAGR